MADESLLRRFRADVRTLSSADVVRKHITFGATYALTEEVHFELKAEISREFQVHPSEVVVVGSAKLGFSLKPTALFRAFYEESDIDIAIVSASLFDRLWSEVYDYVSRGGTWDDVASFKDYVFKGWIRPEKLPQTATFPEGKRIWEYFLTLTNSRKFGPYRLRAGIFRTWQFLEGYQAIQVTACRYEA